VSYRVCDTTMTGISDMGYGVIARCIGNLHRVVHRDVSVLNIKGVEDYGEQRWRIIGEARDFRRKERDLANVLRKYGF